jgi:hypothetical protein
MVSELQMVDSTIDNGVVSGSGTIASNIRLLLRQQFTDKTGATSTKYFRCWGQATYNGDHTNAYQTGTDSAPTSSAWTEDFTEFREDDEDSQYNSRYQGSSDVSFWIIYLTLTGHEGSLEPFKTEMRQIDYSAAGLNMSQVYAFAMTQYILYLSKKNLPLKKKWKGTSSIHFFP